jgi:hypothetical protein
MLKRKCLFTDELKADFPFWKTTVLEKCLVAEAGNFFYRAWKTQIFCNIQKLTNIKLLFQEDIRRRISYCFLLHWKIYVGIMLQHLCTQSTLSNTTSHFDQQIVLCCHKVALKNIHVLVQNVNQCCRSFCYAANLWNLCKSKYLSLMIDFCNHKSMKLVPVSIRCTQERNKNWNKWLSEC